MPDAALLLEAARTYSAPIEGTPFAYPLLARKLLDHVAKRAGWEDGEIRSKMFRHPYTATRLQTLDGGAPVSIYTVAGKLGHTSPAMVQRVYSHPGQVRYRSEAVEYCVEQHAEVLGDCLTALAKGATN